MFELQLTGGTQQARGLKKPATQNRAKGKLGETKLSN
jgi:hypothetical protein